MRWRRVAIWWLVLGCAPQTGRDASIRDAASDAGFADASEVGGADAAEPDAVIIDAGGVDAGGACEENPIPLIVVRFGDTERYYVAVEREGSTAALQLDTGSGLTFLYTGSAGPSYTPNAGTLEIGCEVMSVAGRGFDLPGTRIGAGLEVIGLLGMDFLLDKPSLFEPELRALTRFSSFPNDLVQSAATFDLSFDAVLDHALVPFTIDGEEVRMLFDTGGGHTLWVGQEGQPGDRVEYVQDFEGNVFPIYVGTATVGFPGAEPRVVPMARAPEFPYFQETVRALGGNIHGLLGVTSFPGEALLFFGAELRLYVLSR